MFVTKKLFIQLLNVIGLRLNGRRISQPYCYASAHSDSLSKLNKRIITLEITLKDLTDYLEVKYKTTADEKLPRFVKQIDYKCNPKKEEK